MLYRPCPLSDCSVSEEFAHLTTHSFVMTSLVTNSLKLLLVSCLNISSVLRPGDVVKLSKTPSCAYNIMFNEILFKDQNLILSLSRSLG